MMPPGTIQDGLDLAKVRFAALHPFDLSPETWSELFGQYRPGEILQAIAKTKGTRNPAPSAIYQNLLYWLNRFEKERNEKVSPQWPPEGVTRN